MDQKVQHSYYTAQMLEEVPVGIALLDARDFHVITANRCFREMSIFVALENSNAERNAEKADLLAAISAPSLPLAQDILRSVVASGQLHHQGLEFPALH